MAWLHSSLVTAVLFLALIAGCHRGSAPVQERQEPPLPRRLVVLAKQYDANLEWVEHVRAAAHRGPLLTISLQQEWLSGHPIAFPGVLSDIVVASHDRYIVEVRAPEYYLYTEVQDQFVALQLDCAAETVAPLLKAAVTVSEPFEPTLMVIARISRIQTRKVMTSEEASATLEDVDDFDSVPGDVLKDWKIGFGECLHVELDTSSKKNVD